MLCQPKKNLSLLVFLLKDPKQNARSLLTLVSGTVFYALSHGGLAFALHGCFLTVFLLAENLQQPIRVFKIGGYWSCDGEQNASYHVKEGENLCQKMVSKVTLHFI